MKTKHFFIPLSEVYSPEVSYLRQYMQTREVPPEAVKYFADEFTEWIEQHPEMDKLFWNFMARYGHKDFSTIDDFEELIEELWYELPEQIRDGFSEEIRQEYIEYIMQHDPAFAPTWGHMDYGKTLHRQTWLVHFSDDAYNIARDGFTYGIDDMDRLGLTTYFRKEAKEGGGYNFAFTVDSRYVNYAARERKYGNDAVLFTSSGVEAHHYGDQEDQVIFYGPHIDPRNIILLDRSEDMWSVQVHPSKGHGSIFSAEDFDTAASWAMKNWQQYRKKITGW